MERIDGGTWRTDNGDEVRARGLRVTVEFGERTKTEVLCAVEAVRADNVRLEAENARFYELIGLLLRDWHIEASWDGLRKFWYVGLTDEGVREREEREADALKELKAENDKLRWKLEALKAHGIEIVDAVAGGNEIYNKEHARAESLEVENAKLRACLGDGCADCAIGMGEYADILCDPLKAENAKLRELVRDMWHDLPKSECGWDVTAEMCAGHESCNGECAYWYRMRELGIEVN